MKENTHEHPRRVVRGSDTIVEVIEGGEEVCGGTITAPLALALSAGGAVVIEGSADQLRAVARRALAAIDAAA